MSLGSRVGSNIFVLKFICSASCVLYSAGSGVNIVHGVISVLSMRLFVCVHVCISCKYD